MDDSLRGAGLAGTAGAAAGAFAGVAIPEPAALAEAGGGGGADAEVAEAGTAGAAGAAGAGAAGAAACGILMEGPPAGFGGRLMRTVCFFWDASAGFGGSAPAPEAGGTGGVFSDIKFGNATLELPGGGVNRFVRRNVISW